MKTKTLTIYSATLALVKAQKTGLIIKHGKRYTILVTGATGCYGFLKKPTPMI